MNKKVWCWSYKKSSFHCFYCFYLISITLIIPVAPDLRMYLLWEKILSGFVKAGSGALLVKTCKLFNLMMPNQQLWNCFGKDKTMGGQQHLCLSASPHRWRERLKCINSVQHLCLQIWNTTTRHNSNF